MAEKPVPEKQAGLDFDEDSKTSEEKNESCPKLERVTKRKGVDITLLAEIYKEQGDQAYNKKEFANAVSLYTKALEVNIKDDVFNAKLYSNRFKCNIYLGKKQEALIDFKNAFRLKTGFLKALESEASVLLKLNLYEEAVSCCSIGLSMFDKNETLLDIKARSMEAMGSDKDNIKHSCAHEDGTRSDHSIGWKEEFEEELKLVKSAEWSGNKSLQLTLYDNIGRRCQEHGMFMCAIKFHELQLRIAKELSNYKEMGHAYSHLGNAHFDQGNFKEAIVYHDLHLNITKELGDRKQEIVAYRNLGITYYRLGDFKRAIHYHELCLEIAKGLGDRAQEGSACRNLGEAFHSLRDFERAVYYHQRHLNVSKEDGNKREETLAYRNLGIDYLCLGDVERAIYNHEICLRFNLETGDRDGEANAFNLLGTDYFKSGDTEKANYYYSLSLDAFRKLGNKIEEGRACENLATGYHILKDYKKALYFHQLRLEIVKQTRDRQEEAETNERIGTVYRILGDVEQAITFHERSLEITREVGDEIRVGYLYVCLGHDYQNQGDLPRAVHYQNLALNTFKSVGSRGGQGMAYAALGNSYEEIGDITAAIQCQESSLQIFKELGNKDKEGAACGNLGNSYQCVGDFKAAIKYHELQVDFAKKMGNKIIERKGYLNLGNDYQKLKNYREAIQYHDLSLEIAKEQDDIEGVGQAYANLGNDYDCLGDFEKAVEFHKLHLEVAQKLSIKSEIASAYGNLGNAYRGLQDSHNAEQYYKRQLELAKEIKDIFGEGNANNNLGNLYETQGSYHEALAHFKSSVKLLNNVRARLHFRDEWKINLRHLHQSPYTRLWFVLIKLGKIDEALSAAEQGRTQALKDLMEYNYGLSTLSDNRDESFESEDILLEALSYLPSNVVFFAKTASNVVSWLIRGGLVVKSRIEKTSDVDSTAFFRSLMKTVLTDIGVRSETGASCEDRSLDEEKDESGEHETHTTQEHSQSDGLRSLYDFIIAPMADSIDGDELVIIPEGHLWLVPFAALKDKNSKYLSESLRIRVSPSLTILKTIADFPADYHNKDGALLVGDPWVQEIVTGKKKLAQLPCARKEVEMIGKILNTKPLTDRQATKNEVLKRLSSVALVHIAAHGRMATGEIALCPNPDRASVRPEEVDYLLTITDVLEVKLRAKLVVLSCCHSGRGEVKAEGVVGIARAFLGAGARSVLVSLWAIDDEATLEFMKEFYQQLAEGRSASEALSRAMKSMRKSDDFSEVKYWAPFVLIGDDVTLDFGGGHN
ncbi:tetratricopeptide repeat protein 28-like [Acropora muricata]|uniref:tetratricopeptide repeat protein 28-like n=1 Tax=Acropora muricata TaxID=159855 RepID=UPI0034E47239